MDNIWYRNPSKSEVIGRCDGDEKTEWPRRTDKSRTLKKKEKKNYWNYHKTKNVLNKVYRYTVKFIVFEHFDTDQKSMRLFREMLVVSI